MAKKKKVNVPKSVKKVAKSVKKAAVKPAAKAVAPAIKAVNKAVVKPATKAVSKPFEKKKAPNCNVQNTEITNLKYQITACEKQRTDYINQINTMNSTITNLNSQIGSLNNKVNTLTNRVDGPLVVSEGFVEGFPENTQLVQRGDKYIDYDLTKSGLFKAAFDYKRLYGNYYAGYEDNETMIQDVLNPKIDYLSTTDLDGMEYSYVAVKQQNKTLDSQIEDTADEYSTDFQKAKYVEEEMMSVKKRNAILFFGFYILFFIFAYAFFTGSDLSVSTKGGILAVIFVYPYVIGYVTRIVYFIYTFLSALFRGVPL